MSLLCVVSITTPLLLSQAGVTQPPPAHIGSLDGKVSDASTQQPVGEVTIRIPDLRRGAVTDIHGKFRLDRIPAGRYLVGFHKKRFEAKHLWVTFPAAQPLEIQLEQAIPGAEVTVSATPWATHPLEAPQQTGSIAQEEVLVRSGMSLGEAVSELAGVRNVSTGDASGVPMIRGMVNERVRVLDNGVGVNYQGFSRRHMPTLEPLEADRVDVVRGPASVLFGSQAIGGAVNLIPAPLPTAGDAGTLFSGKVALGAASGNDSRVGRVMLEGARGSFGWRVAATERAGEDTRTPDGTIPNTDFRSGSWSAAGGYSGTWGRLTGRARHFGNRFGFYVPTSPQFRLDLQDELQALEAALFLPLGVLDLSTTRQENNRRAYPNGSDRPSGVDIVLETLTHRARLKHLPVHGLTGDLALELIDQSNTSRALTPSGMRTLLPNFDTQNWAVSLFEEWRPQGETIPGWILSLGLRHDTRELTIAPDLRPGLGTGMERTYRATTGSLGVIYQFTPVYSLAATLGQGWRHPSEFELFAAGPHDGVAAYEQGNPNLKEERNQNLDLSARVEHARVRGKLTWFKNRFKDYIYLYETGLPPVGGLPVLSFSQADATLQGMEVEGAVPLATHIELRTTFERLSTRNMATHRALPFAPPDRATLGARWTPGSGDGASAGHLDLRASWTGKGRPSGSEEPFGTREGRLIETSAYVLWNLAGGVEWRWGKARCTSDLAISNLFDRRYVDFLDTYKQFFPAQGRSIRITLTTSF